MGKILVNVGVTANDKTGDPLRTAFTKANTNMSELFGIDSSSQMGNDIVSAGTLRAMQIGKTYLLPTIDHETFPNSGTNMKVADSRYLAITHRGFQLVNAVVVRTGVQTWVMIAEEYTSTPKQPTVEWKLDLDPAWGDNTGIGGQEATSFTSVIFTILEEIGDPTVFGAQSIVQKIISLEKNHDELSRRIATLEHAGTGSHGHVDIVSDFVLDVENQGAHYLIISDDPSQPDHIGKDLWDGNEHKIGVKWKAGFDPTSFVDGGNTINWDVTPPSVWIVKGGTEFKKIVDPVGGANITYASVKLFIDGSSVLTVKYDTASSAIQLLKVEHGSAHP